MLGTGGGREGIAGGSALQERAKTVQEAVDARAVECHPAVDDDVLPGHETGEIGAEEDDDVRDASGVPTRASGVFAAM